ncbi:uncharacterized protein LOC113216446 [Frankliniella occidentalis]|uniref:Uncharacterized protein LOC113216446 n=1 Tax=Frankliniella occidentalis TaxID=133901 RepID=A0A9C6WV68_FRAOC|nr:uncharacterized protein LOC113216446 [Frankliniella occidentalis]
MDTILDVFFEKVFSQLPRGALVSRYKRAELSDYFGTVIVGCVGAEHVTAQEAVASAVCAALRYHAATRDANGGVCLKGKFHDILYVAAKLAYDWELRDGHTVARLLRDLHACEDTFERLVVGAIVGTRVSHLLSGWKSEFADREENLQAVEFFLVHADEQRLVFGDDPRGAPAPGPPGAQGRRFADVHMRVDTLSLLLRHGATVHFPDRECADDSRATPADVLFGKLLDFRERRPGEPFPEEVLLCLRLLLRAVPSAADSALLRHCPDVILSLAAPDGSPLVPPSRLGVTPPELKHLARCTVRRHLYLAWSLPQGIQALNVPHALRRYLDLELD